MVMLIMMEQSMFLIWYYLNHTLLKITKIISALEQLTLCNTDPTSKDTITEELKDIDGDGLNNSEELELGINPLYFDSDIGGIHL